ncbi:hypothetical protein BH09PLA1_BH09PLA1_07900 [soil metagenome]
MKRPRSNASFFVALIIAIAFVAMLAWSWGGWPDPLVDFGRELYVPWQLSQGKVLYRDIAYFNGPLSPYFNSLLFRTLGASLRTLVFANIAIAASVLVMIYKLWRFAGGRLSATVAALSFVLLFMCLQVVTIGNYNWITPYSHEITHGVALSLAAILATILFATRRQALRCALIGTLLGGVFLTKPEVFAAAALAIGVGVALILRSPRFDRSQRMRAIALLLAGFATPAVVSLLLLALAMPLHDALRGTLGGWWYVFDPQVSGSRFYRLNMGTDQAAHHLGVVIAEFAAAALALGPALILDLAIVRWWPGLKSTLRIAIALVYALALGCAMMIFESRIAWVELFRTLTPLLAIASIILIACAMRRGNARRVLRAMLAIFAAGLLGKLLLVARIYHYGFALALPATLVAFAILVSWLPRSIERSNARPVWTLRLAAIAALGIVAFQYLREDARGFHDKPFVVADGTADQFRADPRGSAVDDMVQILSALPRTTTLAVVPEGSMINYLTRLENPTGQVSLMPPEIAMFGERRILSAFERHPPDYVLLVQANLSDYGYRSLEEYAGEIDAWIRASYTPLPTPQNPAVRTLLLRRNRTDAP